MSPLALWRPTTKPSAAGALCCSCHTWHIGQTTPFMKWQRDRRIWGHLKGILSASYWSEAILMFFSFPTFRTEMTIRPCSLIPPMCCYNVVSSAQWYRLPAGLSGHGQISLTYYKELMMFLFLTSCHIPFCRLPHDWFLSFLPGSLKYLKVELYFLENRNSRNQW